MRERLALLREYLKNRLAFGKNKKTRKGFILTMVALVEVLAISVVSVSAWVETISTITFKAVGAKIDDYVYTNADIGSDNGYSGKTIELNKYFRAAGGVHLASASSADGENIFFPIKNSGASEFGVDSYRCADVNDKNVNYIDFSFNVKVDKTFYANHAEFYLDKAPTITIDGEEDSENLVRMAITDTDTQNTVVCGSEASNKNVVSKVNGDKASEKVKAFSDFVVSPESEPTELFQVKKGSSKTINIKVWLQDDNAVTKYAGKTVSISGVNIVAQNKKGNKVYFVDRTVNDETKNWTKDVKFQQGSKDPVQMNFDENSHTYSCNYTPDADETEVKFISGSVTWTTNMKSLNSDDSMPYTAYGDHNGDVGYGTWGEVVEISVSSNTDEVLPDTGNVLYMVPNQGDTNSKVRMPLTNDKKNWVGYIAKEKADDMTFSFTNNGNPCVIPAPNRGNSTLFVVTSAKTGYWAPPATITVTAGTNGAGTALGEPKVSYDGLTNTTISVTPGTKVKLIANPNKDFALKNWVNSDTGAVAYGIGSDGSFTPAASGNYNFTAVYVESMKFEAYVKTYDGKVLSGSTKGGNVSITCGEKTVSSSTTSSSCNLSALKGSTVKYNAVAEEGYTFGGWYDDPKCTGEAVSNNSEYPMRSVDASKTLYARFNIKVYDVFAEAQYGLTSPDATGGKVSFDNSNYSKSVETKVNHNGIATFYAKPVENYAFIGWYKNTTDPEPKVGVDSCTKIKDSNGNYYYTYKETIKTNDVKLYARFKALCTVDARAMYDNKNVATGGTVQVGKGAPGDYSKDTVMEGDDVTVKAIANKGFKFAGWYTDDICSKPYFKENNNVSPITLNNVSKGITLYAKFVSDSTTIYFYNYNDKWTNVYAYMWGDGNNNNNKGSDTTFGKPMRYLGGKVWEYSYSSSESWKNVIFSNGSTGNGNQSRDITLQQDKKYFKNDDWQPSSGIKHTVAVSNVDNADITVTAGSNTIAENDSREVYDGTSLTLKAENITSGNYCNFIVTSTPSGESKTLPGNSSTYLVDGSDITVSATFSSSSSVKTFYFENTLNWDKFYIYYDNVQWPGTELKSEAGINSGHKVYSFDLDTSKIKSVVLSNGNSGENRTVNIKLADFGNNNTCWISSELQNGNRKVGGYFTFTPSN